MVCGFTVLLWILSGLKSCISILEYMKEDVMKIQKQIPYKTSANLRKDMEHIAGFQVKLNALVRIMMLDIY